MTGQGIAQERTGQGRTEHDDRTGQDSEQGSAQDKVQPREDRAAPTQRRSGQAGLGEVGPRPAEVAWRIIGASFGNPLFNSEIL